MLEACAMLKDTKSIKEIAFELGFDTPKHFSKFFKKHSGQYPGQFRKIITETQ
jgi:AraC-like DNA-binding protein